MKRCAWTLVLVSACKVGVTASDGGVSTPPTTSVGPGGGHVQSPESEVEVSISDGALDTTTQVTIDPLATPPAGAIGQVFDLGPTGLQFKKPVTLTFRYEASALAGRSESSLRVATYADGRWQPVEASVVDPAAHAVTAMVTHFSPWGLVSVDGELADGGATSDAGTSADAGAPTDPGGVSFLIDVASGTYSKQVQCSIPLTQNGRGGTLLAGDWSGANYDSSSVAYNTHTPACGTAQGEDRIEIEVMGKASAATIPPGIYDLAAANTVQTLWVRVALSTGTPFAQFSSRNNAGQAVPATGTVEIRAFDVASHTYDIQLKNVVLQRDYASQPPPYGATLTLAHAILH